MFCPNCGLPCGEEMAVCSGCGNVLPTEPVTFAPPKKGARYPAVIVMAVMVVIGLVCYFLFPKNTVSPGTASQTVPDQWYEFHQGVMTWFYEDAYDSESLTVPDTLEGMPVLRIGEGCFTDADSLTEIVLPYTLVEIDDRAFELCDGLRGMYVPENVLRIGSRAFAECVNLEAIWINGNVQEIAPDAFEGCDSLIHIFYDGNFEDWAALFSGQIHPFTYVYCNDGTYRQGPAQP